MLGCQEEFQDTKNVTFSKAIFHALPSLVKSNWIPCRHFFNKNKEKNKPFNFSSISFSGSKMGLQVEFISWSSFVYKRCKIYSWSTTKRL